jgi:hypothetical protein
MKLRISGCLRLRPSQLAVLSAVLKPSRKTPTSRTCAPLHRVGNRHSGQYGDRDHPRRRQTGLAWRLARTAAWSTLPTRAPIPSR